MKTVIETVKLCKTEIGDTLNRYHSYESYKRSRRPAGPFREQSILGSEQRQ